MKTRVIKKDGPTVSEPVDAPDGEARTDAEVDVVVVGGGPVGLPTAIELTLGGLRVLVLERLAAPSMDMKALAVGPLGSEALQRRGMAAAMAAKETQSLAAMKQFTEQVGSELRDRSSKFSGHFAGLPGLEAIMTERTRSLGIEIRRECDVTNFRQQAGGIDVEWTSPGGVGRVRCSYLVGCDGGRSLIRKMAGFDFAGTAPTLTYYQAVAEIDHPISRWQRTQNGEFSYGVPFPGRLFLLDFSGRLKIGRHQSHVKRLNPYFAESAAQMLL